MLKKSITFEDFNGVSHTKDFYFNLTKADLAVLEIQEKEGLVAMLQDIIQSDDRKKMIGVVKSLITMSYGIKSSDGMKHEKSADISRDFEATNAYSELFFELCTDADENLKFVVGILPQELRGKISAEDIKKQMDTVNFPSDAVMGQAIADVIGFKVPEDSEPLPQPTVSMQDVSKMSREDLLAAYEAKNKS